MAEEKKDSAKSFERHEPIVGLQEDLLGFSELVPRFVEGLRATKPPYVIGVIGEWGVGKTSFLKCVKKEITQSKNFEVVGPIELFRFSRHMDLPAVLVSEMVDHFELKDSKVGKNLLRTLLAILSSLSLRIGSVNLDASELTGKVRKIWRGTKEGLHKEFEELVEEGLKEKKADKVIVMLDDIDRCLPNQALELLETLRLFFDSSKVIFIIAVDDGVIADAITARFGKDVNINGHWYLEKLIDRRYRIPLPTSKQYIEFLNAQYKKITGEDISISKELKSKIEEFTANINPRRFLRAFENSVAMTDFYASGGLEDRKVSSLFLLLLREYSSELYQLAGEYGEVIVALEKLKELNVAKDEDELRESRRNINERYGDLGKKISSDKTILDICYIICKLYREASPRTVDERIATAIKVSIDDINRLTIPFL